VLLLLLKQELLLLLKLLLLMLHLGRDGTCDLVSREAGKNG